MRQHILKIVCVSTIALASSAALAAQEAPGHLDPGVWSGELTPMHHPDVHTPLRFAVSAPAGSPVIEIHGPDEVVIATHDLSVSEAGVVFSFFEPEANIPLRCDLRFQATGALLGRCTDPSGKWASLTMRPPEAGTD